MTSEYIHFKMFHLRCEAIKQNIKSKQKHHRVWQAPEMRGPRVPLTLNYKRSLQQQQYSIYIQYINKRNETEHILDYKK